MIKYKRYNDTGDSVVLSIEFETVEQLKAYEADCACVDLSSKHDILKTTFTEEIDGDERVRIIGGLGA